jgi:hypothetical protein
VASLEAPRPGCMYAQDIRAQVEHMYWAQLQWENDHMQREGTQYRFESKWGTEGSVRHGVVLGTQWHDRHGSLEKFADV